MTVEINKKEIEVPRECGTLAELLQNQGISGYGHAVAVNNRIVTRSRWASFSIADGMKITVIRAVCGG